MAGLIAWVEKGRALVGDELRVVGGLLRGGLVGVVALTCVGNWRWADMSGAVEPELFARQALASVAPNAMVVGEWSTAVILDYYQLVEGLRPDVLVFNQSRY